MRPDDFTAEQVPHLLQLERGWAFVPPPLPPSALELTREITLRDGDARGAIGELVGEARRIETSLLVNPLRRREAVLSNVIEGTYTQVEDVLLGEVLAEDADPSPETTEVLRTSDAISLGQYWLEQGRPLSPALLRDIHGELMRHGRGARRNPGEFRKVQVFIGNPGEPLTDARFVPPPPALVEPAIDAMFDFIGRGPSFGPLIDAALVHYQFEAIHPFEDGNGRLGRALIALQLMSVGILTKPILYLGAFFAAHREMYIELLNQVSKRGAWQPWIEFFLDGVISEARDSIRRLEDVHQLAHRYRQLARAQTRSTTPALAVEFALDRVYVSVPDVMKATGTSAPTSKAAIDVLAGIGMLVPGPRVSGRQYWVAREVIDRLYRL